MTALNLKDLTLICKKSTPANSTYPKGGLEIKVFGENNHQEMDSNMAHQHGTK